MERTVIENFLNEMKQLTSLENDSDLTILNAVKESKSELEDGIVQVATEIGKSKAEMTDCMKTCTEESTNKVIEDVTKAISEIPKATDYTERLNSILSKIEEPIEIKLNII